MKVYVVLLNRGFCGEETKTAINGIYAEKSNAEREAEGLRQTIS